MEEDTLKEYYLHKDITIMSNFAKREAIIWVSEVKNSSEDDIWNFINFQIFSYNIYNNTIPIAFIFIIHFHCNFKNKTNLRITQITISKCWKS